MPDVFFVLVWAVVGGLWRRSFGGWLGPPRPVCYAMALPLTAPIWAVMPWNGVWWPYCIIGSVVLTALCLLFFVVSLYPGGKFTNPVHCLLKYGPFGLGYVLAYRFWRDEWNDGDFIDGPAAVGEIVLGATFWGCVGHLWVLVA